MAKLLEVRGLTKRFGGLVAINDLSFSMEEGEVLGLMGPNGAGKTTVFNILMGDYPVDSGKVFFQGKDIAGLPTYQIVRMGIARTYQVPRPFKEMTIFDRKSSSTRCGGKEDPRRCRT
jgi:branched-chain amino acid transport system ATP-binding protein